MIGPTWGSVAERLIREAQERGEFDALPSRGQPLPIEDDRSAGEHALAFHILRNANVAPPWIESDKEVRKLRERYEVLLDRAAHASEAYRASALRALDEVVRDHDAAVARLNTEAPSDRLHRRPITAAGARTALERARCEAPGTRPPEPDGPSVRADRSEDR
jgi:hypothetical protein